MKPSILNASANELSAWLKENAEPAYRARQILDWIVSQRILDFEPMMNLPKGLRTRLAEDWTIWTSQIFTESSDSEDTRKLLVELHDGKSVECVLLREEDRRTICLSTQVGCGMGCVFCASGLNGVERNLTSGEMIEEMLHVRNFLPPDERLSHIVVMGMGEPLANLDNLMTALDFATSPTGLGISARHVTISTVGLPAKIVQLAETGKSYHLAVSLHAPNDNLRQKIVPTAEKIELADIMAASDEFRKKTGRQVTYEYVLLGNLNDQPEHAKELARLLGRRDAMVNLIPYNPVSGLPYETPLPGRSNRFASILREAGFVVKIRKRKGAAIDAACGQLRRTVGPLVRIT